jgi:hypothetical protein
MAVFLSNSSILVVDEQLGALVAADRARYAYGFLLGRGVFDGSFATAHFDVPTSAFGGYYVVCFGHDDGS